MGFRFRKSFGNKFFRVTFSNKGVSTSAGVPGARISVSSKGRVTGSAGIPGSGLYYTKSKNISSGNNSSSASQGGAPAGGSMPPQKPPKNYNGITILLLIFFFPVGLYFMWAKTNWKKWVKIAISVFIALILLIGMFSPSDETTEPAANSAQTEDASETLPNINSEVEKKLSENEASEMASLNEKYSKWDEEYESRTTSSTTEKRTTTEKETTTKKQTTQPQEITVILNTETGVYHLSSSCSAVKRMHDENKQVITVNDLSEIESSYKPCGICAD